MTTSISSYIDIHLCVSEEIHCNSIKKKPESRSVLLTFHMVHSKLQMPSYTQLQNCMAIELSLA